MCLSFGISALVSNSQILHRLSELIVDVHKNNIALYFVGVKLQATTSTIIKNSRMICYPTDSAKIMNHFVVLFYRFS